MANSKQCYATTYNFADALAYSFEPVMYILSLLISMLCTAGVVVLCCRSALREVPAAILRPKTPKNGKRILIERLKLWRRVSFLHKVSLRNVIRYKQRFFLMILGISGCTALLLTGFGIRDSVQNVTEYQYGEINLYDAEITFTDPLNKAMQEDFIARHGNIESALFLSVCNADMRETIEASFSSLNFVVVLIIICAGILAFIVLFNLININIGERIREIATIKVLGFFNNESSAYIFCEVNMLTAAGTLLGLLFGRFLHAFVMEQIRPDGICFDCRIMWYSYLFSIAITLVFALLVQTVMRIKLKKISMTESLKSVE